MYSGFLLGLVAFVAIISLHEATANSNPNPTSDCYDPSDCSSNSDKKTCCKPQPNGQTCGSNIKGQCTEQDECCGNGAAHVGQCEGSCNSLTCCNNFLCTAASDCKTDRQCGYSCSGREACCVLSVFNFLRLGNLDVCTYIGFICYYK